MFALAGNFCVWDSKSALELSLYWLHGGLMGLLAMTDPPGWSATNALQEESSVSETQRPIFLLQLHSAALHHPFPPICFTAFRPLCYF